MIVINKSSSLTHLPFDDGKRKGVFSFAPGTNNIDEATMAAVAETAGEAAWKAHYGKFLKPVGDADATAETVDPAGLSASDFIDLIEGTTEATKLQAYLEFETAGDQRKTVLAAIKSQAEIVGAIDEKKKSGA